MMLIFVRNVVKIWGLKKTLNDIPESNGTRDNPNTYNTNKKEDLILPPDTPPSKHLIWLNLIFPGLPNIMVGQHAKGLMLMVLSFILVYNIPATSFGVIAFTFWDTHHTLKALREGKAITKWNYK